LHSDGDDDEFGDDAMSPSDAGIEDVLQRYSDGADDSESWEVLYPSGAFGCSVDDYVRAQNAQKWVGALPWFADEALDELIRRGLTTEALFDRDRLTQGAHAVAALVRRMAGGARIDWRVFDVRSVALALLEYLVQARVMGAGDEQYFMAAGLMPAEQREQQQKTFERIVSSRLSAPCRKLLQRVIFLLVQLDANMATPLEQTVPLFGDALFSNALAFGDDAGAVVVRALASHYGPLFVAPRAADVAESNAALRAFVAESLPRFARRLLGGVGGRMVLLRAIRNVLEPRDAADAATQLLALFRPRPLPALARVLHFEVQATARRQQLFRTDSLVTHLFVQWLRSPVGATFLGGLVEPLLRRIVAIAGDLDRQPFDVKAAAAAAAKAKTADIVEEAGSVDDAAEAEQLLEARRTRLLEATQSVIGGIVSSANRVPEPIKRLCRALRDDVEARYTPDAGEDRGSVAAAAVGSVIFLRWICPALVTPELWGIDAPEELLNSPALKRGIILITKVVQNLANGITRFKESYMKFLDPLLEERHSSVRNYLLKLTRNVKRPEPIDADTFSIDVVCAQRGAALSSLFWQVSAAHKDLVAFCQDQHRASDGDASAAAGGAASSSTGGGGNNDDDLAAGSFTADDIKQLSDMIVELAADEHARALPRHKLWAEPSLIAKVVSSRLVSCVAFDGADSKCNRLWVFNSAGFAALWELSGIGPVQTRYVQLSTGDAACALVDSDDADVLWVGGLDGLFRMAVPPSAAAAAGQHAAPQALADSRKVSAEPVLALASTSTGVVAATAKGLTLHARSRDATVLASVSAGPATGVIQALVELPALGALCAATDDGELQVRDQRTLELRASLDASSHQGSPINALALVADASILVSVADDRKLRSFSLPDLEPLARVESNHAKRIVALRVHGNAVYTGSDDGTMAVFDVATWQRIGRTRPFAHNGSVQMLLGAFDLSAHCWLLVSAGNDSLCLWQPVVDSDTLEVPPDTGSSSAAALPSANRYAMRPLLTPRAPAVMASAASSTSSSWQKGATPALPKGRKSSGSSSSRRRSRRDSRPKQPLPQVPSAAQEDANNSPFPGIPLKKD
jgi:GTPase-activator protein for Ras-like GTPase